MSGNKGYQGSSADYAKGGPGDASVSEFLKTPDVFRDSTNKATDENWGKGTSGKKGDGGPAAPKAKSKSLTPIKPRS